MEQLWAAAYEHLIFNDANSGLYNIVSNLNDTSLIKENYPDFMRT